MGLRGDDEFVADDDDSIFSINNCFSDSDKDRFIDYITNKDIIEDVIKSRKYESAAGPDGIDYSVFKIAHNEAATFVRSIMSVIIESGRIPSGWKKSIMRLM